MMTNDTILIIPPEAEGKRLSDYLNLQGHAFSAPCGGRGVCKKCRVKVVSGTFGTVGAPEQPLLPDQDGFVLACQAVCPAEGASIVKPDHTGGGLVDFEDETSAKSTVLSDNIGVALDIGTTTLAAALVDCESGQVLGSASRLNPQQSFGADVISRISACKDGHLEEQQHVILQATNAMIGQLRKSAGFDGAIRKLTVSGNTTMLHLFCGVSPVSMGEYPFTPAFTETKYLSGKELGLDADEVIVLPSASAFIGSDIIGGILVSGLTQLEEPSVLMDLGTNGEMALCTGTKNGGRLITTSTAAGPALEGATISCGMGGVSGAVSMVKSEGDTVKYRTIGDAPAIGVCGCGLIDMMAYLLEAEIIDDVGYLDEDPYTLSGVQKTEDGLLPEGETAVSLNQKDVREFQLAKSAIRAGFEALVDHAGLTPEEIGHIFVAGGLGYYWDTASAAKVGILAEEVLPAVKAIGNSSLAGAIRCLTNPESVEILAQYASGCESFELNKSPVFNDGFIEYMMFPEV